MQNPNPLDTHFDARNEEEEEEEEEEEDEDEEDDDDDDDVEEIEESVAEMAQRVLGYRKSCPDKLKTTLASLLESQRPPIPHPYTQGSPRGSASEASLIEEDPEDVKKLELLKQKISSNASAVSVTLKRMRECMDKMDKLQSQKGVIHPAFKKKMPTD